MANGDDDANGLAYVASRGLGLRLSRATRLTDDPLVAALGVLLHRYTGQTNLLIGTPIANRTLPELELLIGFFANTLVLHTDLSGDPSFRELLGRVKQETTAAYAHQDLPFEKIVEEVRPERDLSRSPLFQVMFSHNNTPMQPVQLPGLTASIMNLPTRTAKFDL